MYASSPSPHYARQVGECGLNGSFRIEFGCRSRLTLFQSSRIRHEQFYAAAARSSSASGKPVVVKFDGGRPSSDGGVSALREVEQRLRVADRLAACMIDPRAADQITHSLADVIRFRLLMISAGLRGRQRRECAAPRSDVHVWMPPFATDVFERLGRVIGCGHVSGLETRPVTTAGRYGDARPWRGSEDGEL